MDDSTIPVPVPKAGPNKDGGDLSLSPTERRNCRVLIIEPDQETRAHFRSLLRQMGCGEVASSPDHLAGLGTFESYRFTHVLFDARASVMPPREFLVKVMEKDQETIAIPASFDPTVDDVFTLLIAGAQGFLVKPFTLQTLEEAILLATKGEPIADCLLHAKDRNQALAALAMTALDTLTLLIRQARQFETAKQDIPKAFANMKRAVEMGKLFAEGGKDAMVEAYLEYSTERASGPATRLGRSRARRHQLRQTKTQDQPGTVETPS